ncbi:2-C-methyl-D-erythritol 4-phosphate cytidylyltransferase [Pseudoxanthomonas sp. X-1]|nr:2-C-methyl-D-erythritol 4-phosphate cytidylyltransferase [Pseudoxanthomonas sp. X-1]
MRGIWVVIPAAGRGTRFGGEVPKQYLEVGGQSVLAWTLAALLGHPLIEGAVVALSADDPWWPGWTAFGGKPVLACVGGGTRAASVLAALQALPEHVRADDFVLVHDAARPNLADADLERLIERGREDPVGALLAAPVRDTLKRAGDDGGVDATEPRERLWRALTPQMFRRLQLTRALDEAAGAGIEVTDESMAMERQGLRPLLVEGNETNFKITTPGDLDRFAYIVKAGSAGAPMPDLRDTPVQMPKQQQQASDVAPAHPAPEAGGLGIRIGQGFDVHAFAPDGDHVMLGGVRVEHSRGVLAHSDGDVVIHALCDAILGALALGDIGRHFPPTDPRWEGADSTQFLEHCAGLARARGWQVGNADVTVMCERPKVGPHALAMCTHLAQVLGVAADAVSVKATTTEKLGFTGRGEGIAAQAVVLLVRA